MSQQINIVTKRGDDGLSDVLFGTRISKSEPIFTVLGELDTLKVDIGFAVAVRIPRHWANANALILKDLQTQITAFSGRMCVPDDCYERYANSKLLKFDGAVQVAAIEGLCVGIQESIDWEQTWSVPGEGCQMDDPHSMSSLYLERCRVQARKVEHEYHKLRVASYAASYTPFFPCRGSDSFQQHAPIWLNRLSDLFWLLAQQKKYD